MPTNVTKSQYQQLDHRLHSWAVWVQNDKKIDVSTSPIYKMMNSGGLVGGAGQVLGLQCHEAELEEALMKWIHQSEKNRVKVDVLRYEYDALTKGWSGEVTQTFKAHRIGIELRTYTRRLKACKDHLITALDIK